MKDIKDLNKHLDSLCLWIERQNIVKGEDRQVSETELRAQKQTHTHRINGSLTKGQKQFSGERIFFTTNGSGTIRHSQAKKLIYTPSLHISSTTTQNG